MKLKNSELQELYDTIVASTITISPYADSPLDKAFRECDEKLSYLQDRNDILEKSNEALLGANMKLASDHRKLEKDLDDAKNHLNYFTHSRDDWRSRAKHAEETLNKANADREEQQKNLDLRAKINISTSDGSKYIPTADDELAIATDKGWVIA